MNALEAVENQISASLLRAQIEHHLSNLEMAEILSQQVQEYVGLIEDES